MKTDKPLICGVHGGSAAVNRGADFVQYLVQSPLAPEQGTGPALCTDQHRDWAP